MKSTGVPPTNSPRPGTIANVVKVAGGVIGFAAVLTLHQWHLPFAVTEPEGINDNSSTPVVVEADPIHTENAEAIQTSDEDTSADDASNTNSDPAELPIEDVINTELEVPISDQLPASSTQSVTLPGDMDLVDLPNQDTEVPLDPSSGVPTTSDESQRTEIPTIDVPAISNSSQSADSSNNNTGIGMKWSAVWRPFFSETTAQGFADYISDSTGLTLRVQKSPVVGHYLVEVQHSTEAQRIDADRRIVETTGYRPPGAIK